MPGRPNVGDAANVVASLGPGLEPAAPDNKEHDQDDHDDDDDGLDSHWIYRLLLEVREGKIPPNRPSRGPKGKSDRRRVRRLLTSRIGADKPAENARHGGLQDHRLAMHQRLCRRGPTGSADPRRTALRSQLMADGKTTVGARPSRMALANLTAARRRVPSRVTRLQRQPQKA